MTQQSTGPETGNDPTQSFGPTDQPADHREAKRLFRSRENRMIAGVCGGIAEYLSIDPAIVRLGMVALTLCGGGGIVAYVAAWVLIPEA